MPSYPSRIAIPPGDQPPVNPSTFAYTPYEFETSSPDVQINGNSYYAGYGDGDYQEFDAPSTAYPGFRPEIGARPMGRTVSAFEPNTAQFSFPEPQLSRSFSSHSSLHPNQSVLHGNSRNDVSFERSNSISGGSSIADFSPRSEPSILSDELSHLTLDSEEGLRRFQENQLLEADEEWYRLVPPEAREVLDKNEVQRQSVLFEVFKSEKDYVHDLELIQEVFVTPFLVADPPVLSPDRVQGFVSELFWNLESVSAHHHRMLASLFARQREQHPLVQSVADIILDTSLLFRQDYESYIEHYPIAEALHRSELRKNPEYQAFIQNCSQDPRIRKRDLITFLSRPVTRLPRLYLVLEHILKLTQPDHPDLDNLPLILSLLNEFLKSTQPGIAAAESKVKFWYLCEGLVYMKGEIMEMDFYDDSRTLVYSGSLARRSKSEVSRGWLDLHVALLDNYLLLTKEEKLPNGVVEYHLTSRPIPLEYLRLGAFDAPAESRREKSEGILDTLRSHHNPVYPFTVYHASAKASRRYTLYTTTEGARNKWHEALVDALAVRKVRQEGNMWFAPHDINDGSFRSSTSKVPANVGPTLTGKITSIAQIASGGRKVLIVGCFAGIYAGLRGESSFKKILSLSNPTSIYVLQDVNKIVIHHGAELIAYSSEVLARYALGNSSKDSLDATFEKVAGYDGTVLFCRPGQVGRRIILIIASKSFLQVTIHALEAVDPGELHISAKKRTTATGSASFRSFGDPFSIPKDAFDVTTLTKSIGICTEKGVIIADPTNLTSGSFNLVPNFAKASDDLAMNHLRTRCDAARALGLVRCDSSEVLVVYDELGCYIDKYGNLNRSSGYIRWETKATSFAAVGTHVLLFSPEFIEVRHVKTGKLVQVIEGQDIRLLDSGFKPEDRTIFVGMKGDKDDHSGASYKIVELVETEEIQSPSTATLHRNGGDAIWDMWDM